MILRAALPASVKRPPTTQAPSSPANSTRPKPTPAEVTSRSLASPPKTALLTPMAESLRTGWFWPGAAGAGWPIRTRIWATVGSVALAAGDLPLVHPAQQGGLVGEVGVLPSRAGQGGVDVGEPQHQRVVEVEAVGDEQLDRRLVGQVHRPLQDELGRLAQDLGIGLIGVVAAVVVVGVADAARRHQGHRFDALGDEGRVVAAAGTGRAGLDDGDDVRVLVALDDLLPDLGEVQRAGGADPVAQGDHVQVEVGDDLVHGDAGRGLGAEVVGAEQAHLLAAPGGEDDGPLGLEACLGQHAGHFHGHGRAGGVVVGAVHDHRAAGAEVVEVAADDDISGP